MNSLSISKSRINHKIILLGVIFFAVFCFIFGNVFNKAGSTRYRELNSLKNNNLSFNELSTFFKDLALKKGAQYAFGALNVAELPPNTDYHLLGHSIGNILYKQQGIDGIKICSQDFRNSCSHSIVIGLFIDKGIEALTDIAKVCREAPGGMGAYGMCFHGLGHGILAYTGYDMEKAVELCNKTGTPEVNYVETAECVGGVTMEMVAGVHDETAWKNQKDKYLTKDDPLYPCNQPFIPAVAKPNCFLYLTPHLWEAAGGKIEDPQEKDFAKAFSFCSKLTGVNSQYQDLCYGGFGKEFVGLAMSRDIRKVSEINDSQLDMVYKWCLLADQKRGVVSCLHQAINSLYWGGENKPFASINFCKVMSDDYFKNVCYEHIIGAFKFYNHNRPSKFYGLCRLLPESYLGKCLDPNYYEHVD